jgi:hypothetical protein
MESVFFNFKSLFGCLQNLQRHELCVTEEKSEGEILQLSASTFSSIFERYEKPLVLQVISKEHMTALSDLAKDQGSFLYYASLDVKDSKENLELAHSLFGQTRNPPYFVVYPVGDRKIREKTRSIVSARVPAEELYDEVVDTLPKKVKYLEDQDVEPFIDQGIASNKMVLVFLGPDSFPLWIRIVMNDPKFDSLLVAGQILHPDERALSSFGVSRVPSLVVIYRVIGGEPSPGIADVERPQVLHYQGRREVGEFRDYLDLVVAQSVGEQEEKRQKEMSQKRLGPEGAVFQITGQEVFSSHCGNDAKFPCLIAVLDGRKVINRTSFS